MTKKICVYKLQEEVSNRFRGLQTKDIMKVYAFAVELLNNEDLKNKLRDKNEI